MLKHRYPAVYKLLLRLRGRFLGWKKKIVLFPIALSVIVALFFLSSRTSQAAWYSDNWNFRKQLTIQESRVSGSSDLTNFPVLISLNDQELKAAQSDGDDILFTSENGTTKLDHEIESFDNTTGILLAWVEIPTLDYNNNTVIYMYYGNSSTSSQQNGTGVWDSNYKIVHHLHESASPYQDGTSNNKDGSEGTVPPTATTGKIGGGQDFDGSDDKYEIASPSLPTGDFTYELWFRPDAVGSEQDLLGAANGTLNDEFEFGISGGNVLTTELDDVQRASSTATVSTGSWYHLVVTRSGSSITQYINASSDGTGSYGTAVNFGSCQLLVGNDAANDCSADTAADANGAFDELRISSIARSSDWLTTEYNNQSSPSTFFTIGTQERKEDPALFFRFDEGYGTIAQDSSTNNNDGTLGGTVGGSSSGPTKIDDAGDPGSMLWSGKQLIRTSAGTLYSFINDGGSCEMWKSTDGSSWTEQDSSNNPSCLSGTGELAVAVDSSNVIHMVYMTNARTVAYNTFSTSTDTFGTSETAVSGDVNDTIQSVVLVLDNNDIPHIAYALDIDSLFEENPRYRNRVGGSWNSAVDPTAGALTTVDAIDITINEDNIPELSMIDAAGADLEVTLGNANNATSFTVHAADTTVLLTGGIISTGIGVDSSGNTWVAYVDENGATDFPTLVKHNDADGWTTWQSPLTNSNGGSEPSLAINDTDIYIFYQDDATDTKVVYDRYNGSTWLGETTLQTPGTGVDYKDVKNHWSYINNYDSTGTAPVQTNTYYLDASDAAASDPNSVWTTDANAFDSGDDTTADVAVAGSTSSNYLQGEGTNAPATGGTITSVKARLRGAGSLGVEVMNAAMYTDSLGELLGTASMTAPVSVGWSGYTTLSTPSGGWTWAKVQALETKLYCTNVSFVCFFGKIEILVQSTNSTTPTQFDYLYSDGTDIYWASLGFGAAAGVPTRKTEEQCVSNGCLFFDGSDDAVVVTNASTLDFDQDLAGALTFQAWIRVNSDGENNVGQILQKGTNTYIRVTNEGADGKADLETSLDLDTTDATATVTDGITLNKWHHVVMAYTDDGDDDTTIYIDGVSKTTGSGSGAPATGDTNPLLVGGTSTANFHGFIDQVKIYKSERSAAEVKTDGMRLSGPHGAAASFGEKDSSYLSNGLIGYWKMDETSGDASDISGEGTTLTNNSTTPFTPAKFANGAEMDGSTDFFDITDPYEWSGAITLSAWIIPDNVSGEHVIIGNWDQGSENWYFATNDDELILYLGSASEQTTSANLSANTVYHVAATYTPSSQKVFLYVNGILQASTTVNTIPSSLPNTSGTLSIGAIQTGGAGSSNNFDGHIDDVRMYNRAFSDKEILSLYDWAPSPVAYWDLNEGSGTTANDKSGNAKTGTLTNGPLWSQGKFGQSLKFDGSNDHVTVGDQLDFNGNTPFALSSWVNLTAAPAASQFGQILSKYDAGSAGEWWFAIDENRNVSFLRECGSFGTVSTSTINLNTWYHVAGTYDGTNLRIYINGVLDKTTADSCSITNQTVDMMIGAGDDGSTVDNVINGAVDDIRIYDYARSAKQILEDMNTSHPIVGTPVSGPAGHWSFDEGNGTTANDKSVNRNNLTSGGILATTMYTNAGKFGKAWRGFGANWLSKTDDPDFDFAAADDLSISIWFRSIHGDDPTDGQILIDKHNGTLGYNIFLQTDGDLVFEIDDTSNTDSVGDNNTDDYYDAAWHHVVATKQGTSRIDLYIDGKLRYSDTSLNASGTLANDASLILGDSNGSNGTDEFMGVIDEVKIYRAAMNADQIKTEYNQGKSIVLGSLATDADGTATNSAIRSYCPPGNTETNCASGSDPSPVGEWRLNEGSGTTANDASTNGNTGTLNGSTSFTSGKIGSAVNFTNTSGDYITAADSSTLNFTASSDFTLEAWVYRSTATEHDVVIAKKNADDSCSSDAGYSLYLSSGGTVRFWGCDTANNSYNLESTTTLSTNSWYHIIAVWDDDSTTNTAIFINGAKETSTPTGTLSSVGDMSNAQAFRIGSESDGGNRMSGRIDSALVYNYVRTPAQIAWDYNRGEPIGWWKFDECTGSTVYDWTVSGNNTAVGNNGTISAGDASGNNDSAGTCNSGTGTEMWDDGTTGKYNSSLGFDGTNDVVSMGNNASLNFTNNIISFAGWIKRASSNEAGYIVSRGLAGSNGYGFGIGNVASSGCSSTQITASKFGVVHACIGTLPADTNWHHIAVVWSTTGGVAYIDGVLSTPTSANTSNIATSTSNFRVGAQSSDEDFFAGQVDDIRIYNYPLTLQQVKLLYNQTAAVRFGPLQGSP